MSTAPFKKRPVNAERVARAALASLPLAARQEGGWVTGGVYDIPLGKVKPNPANARAIYPVAAGQRMSKALQQRGQDTAATGFLDDEGFVVLIDGHRRLQGCQVAGLPTLRVEIRPKPASDVALYLASRDANADREDQTPLDDALVWRRLLDRKVFASQVALARTLGVSESEVSRTLALADLPGRVQQSLAEEPALCSAKMLNAFREFFAAFGEEPTLALVLEASKQGFGYREVEARRKAGERAPVKRARSSKSDITFRAAKGSLRLFDDGARVELSLRGLNHKDSTELVQRLQEALQA